MNDNFLLSPSVVSNSEFFIESTLYWSFIVPTDEIFVKFRLKSKMFMLYLVKVSAGVIF